VSGVLARRHAQSVGESRLLRAAPHRPEGCNSRVLSLQDLPLCSVRARPRTSCLLSYRILVNYHGTTTTMESIFIYVIVICLLMVGSRFLGQILTDIRMRNSGFVRDGVCECGARIYKNPDVIGSSRLTPHCNCYPDKIWRHLGDE